MMCRPSGKATEQFVLMQAADSSNINISKSNRSFIILTFFGKGCNELAGPNRLFRVIARSSSTAPFEKCRSGGEPLATLYAI